MAVKICENCGKTLRSTDVFCMNCGVKAPLEVAAKPVAQKAASKPIAFCPECGKRVRQNWSFCMSCGQRLRKPQPNSVAGPTSNIEWQGQPISPIPESTKLSPLPITPLSAVSQGEDSLYAGGSDLPESDAMAKRDVLAWDFIQGGSESQSQQHADVQQTPHAVYNPLTSTRTIRIDDLSAMAVGADAGSVYSGYDFASDMYEEWEKTDAGFPADDAPTTVYNEDEDEDALTMVYEEEKARPTCKFTRASTGDVISCDSLPTTLGRGSLADVRITGNPYVGRKHVRVTERDGEFYVEDLGSANHTFINGIQLAPEQPTPIHNGDVVALGKEELTVTIE